MAEDFRLKGPTPAELVELLEKQDAVMDSLQQELLVCREQLHTLTQADVERIESEDVSKTLVSEAEKKVHTALAAVEALHAHNEKLESELNQLKMKIENDRPAPTVISLRDKLKESEFELEREKQTAAGLRHQLEVMSTKLESVKHESEIAVGAKDTLFRELSAKLESASKQLAETTFKLEGVTSDRDHASVRLAGELEIVGQRERHLDTLTQQLNQETSNLRKERATMQSRLAALTHENASLRTKLACKSLDDTIAAEPTDQMQRLLSDQSHLIAALREEGSLLTEMLERERKDWKVKVRELKREKRELEDRLSKVLKI